MRSINLLTSVLTILGSVSIIAAQEKICRALVMSGGANKGAYEAGVLHGLSHLLNGSDAHYDVVSGVSAGALNSAGVAMFPPNKPIEMSEWLVGFWRKVSTDMIYQSWPGGFEEGFYNESGIFDSSPLYNTLVETMAELGGVIQRKIVVAAVDVENGDYVTYTELNTSPEEFPRAALASSSIPFVFPNQQIGGRVLMDGGTVWNTNIASAIDRCRETVGRDEDITMDIIICDDDKLSTINATGNTISNFLRYWSVSGFNKALSDVSEMRRAFP